MLPKKHEPNWPDGSAVIKAPKCKALLQRQCHCKSDWLENWRGSRWWWFGIFAVFGIQHCRTELGNCMISWLVRKHGRRQETSSQTAGFCMKISTKWHLISGSYVFHRILGNKSALIIVYLPHTQRKKTYLLTVNAECSLDPFTLVISIFSYPDKV